MKVTQSTSAFMIDLQLISFLLRNCTERSLLLIDEFGKGTNATDGAGLFVGLIKELVTMGARLPKTLLATHFHEIFMNDFLKSRLPVGLAHMELLISKHGAEEEVRGKSMTPATNTMGVGMNAARGKEEDPSKIVCVEPLFR